MKTEAPVADQSGERKRYFIRRAVGERWKPVDRAEYARGVLVIDGLAAHCSEGAAVAEVTETDSRGRLRHCRYDGPAFEPGERVAVAEDKDAFLTRARGCLATVLGTVGPFVMVRVSFDWPPPVKECGIRCVLPEFLTPVL